MNSPTSNSEDAPPTEAFDRLHDDLQKWVWQQGWEKLHPIQERAIPVVLEGESDVVLASPTASGKTEAAFLPILSRVRTADQDEREAGFDVLYISPLKALINDQYERLQSLGENCGIEIHRRHGDVSSSKKRKALEEPEGILLITPESLEALFLHRGPQLHRALRSVSYVVVDELHSFIGTPRGKQLQSLLHRVEQVTPERIPRIALSATIGDPKAAAEFLRPGAGAQATLIEAEDTSQAIKLLVKGYETQEPGSDDEEDEGEGTEVDIAEHVFANLRGIDNLVFANRRRDVELYADILKRLSERSRVPNEFYPHHGSLSKEIREGAERALKDEASPASVLCTNTLELGIDVGWVHSIGQIGSPPSVSSMRQRLGRSGRRGNPAIMRVYVQEPEIGDGTPVQDMLRPELVQTIAMVNLLLDRWYEPPNLGALELSTLVQQVLSLIAEQGGVQAADAYRVLCGTGPFDMVSQTQFKALLQDLHKADLINQAGDGDLIMGLAGEKLISHYDFYAAFSSPEEYRLVAEEKTLGTLPVTYPLIEGQLLIFGGERWEIQEVEESNNVVFLKPAAGGRVPVFSGEGAEIHDRIREEMYDVYTSEDVPIYLDDGGEDLLAEGRMHFHRFDLDSRDIVSQGQNTILFVWAGDRTINTVLVLLSWRGLKVSKSGMSLEIRDATPGMVLDHLRTLLEGERPQSATLAESVENKIIDKHDTYLRPDLLDANYASKRLDVDGASKQLERILSRSSEIGS
jgi:ATP-dependent Lhr-like helicase